MSGGPLLGSPNRLKLAVFASNMAGGTNLTRAEGPPTVDWPESVRIARAADTAGIEALIPVARWRGMGDADEPAGHRSFEPFTWAAGLASVTERIGLFATVHVPTAHPLRVAKEAATVDHISGGRFGLNVVAGWNADELDMFGVGLADHDDRYAVADEWATLLERCWAETGPFDFDGRHFQARNVISEPKPLQAPRPPLMGAGASPAGRAFAARHADVSFVLLPGMDGAAEAVAAMKDEAASVAGAEPLVFAAAHIVCKPTRGEAEAWFEDVVHRHGDWAAAANALRLLIPGSQSADFDREGMGAAAIAGFFALPLVGSPDDVVTSMSEVAEAGFDGLAVSWIDYEDGLRQYVEELAPRMVEAGLRVS